jgi:hypothetical protein
MDTEMTVLTAAPARATVIAEFKNLSPMMVSPFVLQRITATDHPQRPK